MFGRTSDKVKKVVLSSFGFAKLKMNHEFVSVGSISLLFFSSVSVLIFPPKSYLRPPTPFLNSMGIGTVSEEQLISVAILTFSLCNHKLATCAYLAGFLLTFGWGLADWLVSRLPWLDWLLKRSWQKSFRDYPLSAKFQGYKVGTLLVSLLSVWAMGDKLDSSTPPLSSESRSAPKCVSDVSGPPGGILGWLSRPPHSSMIRYWAKLCGCNTEFEFPSNSAVTVRLRTNLSLRIEKWRRQTSTRTYFFATSAAGTNLTPVDFRVVFSRSR